MSERDGITITDWHRCAQCRACHCDEHALEDGWVHVVGNNTHWFCSWLCLTHYATERLVRNFETIQQQLPDRKPDIW